MEYASELLKEFIIALCKKNVPFSKLPHWSFLMSENISSLHLLQDFTGQDDMRTLGKYDLRFDAFFGGI